MASNFGIHSCLLSSKESIVHSGVIRKSIFNNAVVINVGPFDSLNRFPSLKDAQSFMNFLSIQCLSQKGRKYRNREKFLADTISGEKKQLLLHDGGGLIRIVIVFPSLKSSVQSKQLQNCQLRPQRRKCKFHLIGGHSIRQH